MIRVTALHVYPLKGARGLSLDRVAIGRFGPEGDRRWLVVDRDDDLVTQREVPHLCRISARPEPGGLVLEAPGRSPLQVATPVRGARRLVRVWRDRVDAADAGDGAAGWLSDYLGRPVRLVHLPDLAERRTDPEYDPVGGWVSFADGYPLLVASEESLAELNRRLDQPLPMNRFRPNVVVAGVEPFGEDRWRRFRIGAVPFDAVKPCARCTVTTTDQVTAERGAEPLRTLAGFRRGGLGVLFGMNLVHRGEGTIAVGDPVALETA